MKASLLRRKYFATGVMAAICLMPLFWTIEVVAQRSETGKTDTTTVLPAYDNATTWLRTELYYGAGRVSVDGGPDQRWEDYMNNVVTPRFSEGLTLLEGTGQWRVKPGEKPRRNRTRILILVHEATIEKDRQLKEIITIWKEISGHQSVLRVSLPAEVSM